MIASELRSSRTGSCAISCWIACTRARSVWTSGGSTPLPVSTSAISASCSPGGRPLARPVSVPSGATRMRVLTIVMIILEKVAFSPCIPHLATLFKTLAGDLLPEKRRPKLALRVCHCAQSGRDQIDLFQRYPRLSRREPHIGRKLFLRETADDATDIRKAGSLLQQEGHISVTQDGRGHLMGIGKPGIIGGAHQEMGGFIGARCGGRRGLLGGLPSVDQAAQRFSQLKDAPRSAGHLSRAFVSVGIIP